VDSQRLILVVEHDDAMRAFLLADRRNCCFHAKMA
jgi:hypothetical protein